jgi:hypothetical protein
MKWSEITQEHHGRCARVWRLGEPGTRPFVDEGVIWALLADSTPILRDEHGDATMFYSDDWTVDLLTEVLDD